MDEVIISVGGGKMQLALINSIKKQDYGVIVIDRDNDCPGKYESDYFINMSTYNYENVIGELEKIMDRFIFKAVMVKSTGKPVLTAAKIAERFSLEFVSTEVCELTLNKTMLIGKMKEEGILCPESYNKNNFKFPVIIKPKGGTGGKKSVFLIKNNEELTNIKNEIDFKQEIYEIQEYIEGKDCVFFAAIKDKKIIYYTIIDELNKCELDGNNNVSIKGLGFSIPSIYIGTEQENVIFNVSQKIIEILDVNTSIIWISYRINNRKPYLIEIHLDLGGEYVLDKLMSYYYTDNNLINEAVRLYTNSKCFDINKGYNKFVILFDNYLIKNVRSKCNVKEIETNDLFSIFKNISIDDVKSII